MYAIKANRQYKISEDEKQKYIDQGFKIAKLVKGNLEFEEVETEETKEVAKLEAEIKKMKEENSVLSKENDTLKTEIETLKEPKQGKAKGEGK